MWMTRDSGHVDGWNVAGGGGEWFLAIDLAEI